MIKNRIDVNRILLIKLRGIGDVLLSTIVIRNLAIYFPNAKIDFLTEPPSVPIINNLSELNEIIAVQRKGVLNTIKAVLKLRKKKYDIVFDLYTNPRSALLTFLSKGKAKVGFNRRGRRYAYDLAVNRKDALYHSAEVNLFQLESLDIPTVTKELIYRIKDDEKDFAKNVFISNNLDNIVIGISPSGGWDSKRCKPSKFIEICKAIRSKYLLKFIVLWGESDKSNAEEIYNSIKEFSVLAPKTSIREMAALMSKCNAVIANDSGPMHISAAIGIPTLAIHGPTSPFEQGPYGSKHEWVRFNELECIQCNLIECPRQHECMTQLNSNEVLAKFELLLIKNDIEIKNFVNTKF